MKRNELMPIVELVEARDIEGLRAAIAEIADASAKTGTWEYHAHKLLRFLDTGVPEFSIFKDDGNIKLPFVAFSALALATCPGKGECKDFCYSLRAWRYPAAFFRQVQNSILLWTSQETITADMARILDMPKFRNLETVDVRLYVDGDLDGLETARFWFEDFLPSFPKLRAYGYSKSFGVLRDYAESGRAFPSNYVLNLSSGSRYDGTELVNYVANLPVTRGRFVAVPIDTKGIAFSAPKGDYRKPEYRALVREAFDEKGFVCPGQCGSCTGAGHACGNPNIEVPILIGIH